MGDLRTPIEWIDEINLGNNSKLVIKNPSGWSDSEFDDKITIDDFYKRLNLSEFIYIDEEGNNDFHDHIPGLD